MPNAGAPSMRREVHGLLVDMFGAQAACRPQAPAVVDDGKVYTYAELDQLTNRLGRHLREQGVRRGTITACCLRRSARSVIYTLAVLKAGGTYLLIDAPTPQRRLDRILADAQPVLVVSDELRLADLQPGCPVVHPAAAERDAAALSSEPVAADVSPDDPAYLAYTSGSTGQPKGVLVNHAALANHVRHFAALFDLGPRDRVPLMSPVAFDVATEEMLPPLIAGCTSVVTRAGYIDVAEFANEITEQRYTVLNLPAPLWHAWVTHLEAGRTTIPESLRLVIVGSDKIYTSALRRWQQLPGARWVRWAAAYGTTETCVTSTIYLTARQDDLSGEPLVPIGTPFAGARTYVVTATGALARSGEIGELYIGGPGVATGYHRMPQETAKAFVANTFDATPDRLYRTGDLVRSRPDGNLVWVGRKDDQMKINGLRVEPGEVEAAIHEYTRTRTAVTLHPSGGRQEQGELVAFVETPRGGPLDEQALRSFLGTRLPPPMQPSTIVHLDALPTDPNGKIDRRALAALLRDPS
jgi:amino acid adenylation domain-containing protein